MKNLHFLLFTFLLASISLKSQLSGNAFLSGQTNHSGIKIKFTAASGTAVTDSVFTNTSGNYTANIINGVYTIAISKTGYISHNYSNGTSQLLTNTVVLNSTTLLPGTQLNVSGNVSGNWTSGNVYIVNGDITIPAGSALTIQAGTIIKFNGSYSLVANGTLTAVGTPSNKIIFTSNLNSPAPADWRDIELHTSASILDYCVVEYAAYGIYFSSVSPTISHSIIRNIETVGIYCNNCQPKISNNEVYDIKGNNGAIGIWVENNPCCGIIECNQVYSISSGYHAYGMITGSNFVRNNVIHDITTTSGLGPAIEVRGNSRIENNYLYNAVQGIEDDNTFGPATPTIINNTIRNTTTGISVLMPQMISNNIITENTYGMNFSSSSGVNVSHNLVWSNGTNYVGSPPTGIGQMVSTNTQGNSIDSYFNLSQDPLYVVLTSPLLNNNSPCIGAGDVSYASNIGFSPIGTCAVAIPLGLSSLPANMSSSLTLYPNPANGIFHVVNGSTDIKSLRLYNVSGQEMKFEKLSETDFNVSQLPNGIYFLVVETKAGSATKKLVITH